MWRTLKRVGSLSIGQRGVALLEILVGLALLGIIGVAFISGMTSTFNAIGISQERVAAESLAKSQIEYLKVQDYIYVADYNPSFPATSYDLITVPADLAAAGYSVNISVPGTIIDPLEGGFELQSVNITVSRNNERKLQVSTYQVSPGAQ
jgi:type II secretory pathway pseudopilin PulG